MTAPKTRCKQCHHIGANVKQEPCNKCAEIQYCKSKNDNYFLDSSKNLMKDKP